MRRPEWAAFMRRKFIAELLESLVREFGDALFVTRAREGANTAVGRLEGTAIVGGKLIAQLLESFFGKLGYALFVGCTGKGTDTAMGGVEGAGFVRREGGSIACTSGVMGGIVIHRLGLGLVGI